MSNIILLAKKNINVPIFISGWYTGREKIGACHLILPQSNGYTLPVLISGTVQLFYILDSSILSGLQIISNKDEEVTVSLILGLIPGIKTVTIVICIVVLKEARGIDQFVLKGEIPVRLYILRMQ